jgi:cell division protein FtsX
MYEFDDRIDDRLRAALDGLRQTMEQQIRPAGVGLVPVAARRRRRTMHAAATALALVFTSGLATGWWLVRDTTPPDRAAAPGCVPAQGAAFLPSGATDELRAWVGAILRQSPGVDSAVYESREEAYRQFTELYGAAPDRSAPAGPDNLPESWRFTLRCGADYPAVKERLGAVPGVEVTCSCDPRVPADRTRRSR